MTRKVIIIAPNDNCLDDILNFNLDFDMLHIDVAKQYAINKKINNVTEGYNDLASENYVVLFTIDNVIEFYAGESLNDNQIVLLKELFDIYFKVYKELKLELGIFENKQFKVMQGGFKSLDELLDFGYKVNSGKGDENVRKKI